MANMLAGTSCILWLAVLALDEHKLPPLKNTTNRSFRMPVAVSPADRNALKCLRLFVSTDQGKTWQMWSEISPDTPHFEFTAPQDGTYWFQVQVEDKAGRREPRHPFRELPAVRVRVDTQMKMPALKK
jgi:hypothetical protein